MPLPLQALHLTPYRCLRRLSTASSAALLPEPLRILFCGSDAFSIYALRALDEYRRSQPSAIEQIDVLCRPDKRVGRGRKQIQSVPIKAVSQELGLSLHQLDTFKDWTDTSAFNLIVTASFGLLVPARVLSSAKFGGLNVHPSLLPDFRGAAPIQYAIMHRVETTGVSVQTMHPTRFDHGVVLEQEEVDLSVGSGEARQLTTEDLVDKLGPIGGALLVKSIQSGAFLRHESVTLDLQLPRELRRAPKIKPVDREIDWSTWTAEEILARDRALGQLWDRTSFIQCDDSTARRLVFKGPWSLLQPDSGCDLSPGSPLTVIGSKTAVGWKTVDGALIAPSAATLEGESRDQGLITLRRKLCSRRERL